MSSISQLTEEEKNFARFFLLNFKVSPDIARRFFDGVFPPTHLPQIINRCMHAIINLNKKKRINAAQLGILRAIPGTVWPSYLPPMSVGTKATSSKDFDLTMMICLLRNLGGLTTPSTGWDQLPHPSDTLPGAHLATLKCYRNQMAHTTLTSMDNNEFTDKWTLVEKALTSLNNGQIPHEVTEIMNYDLDGEQAKLLANAELEQLKKEYMDCEKEKEQIESDFSYYKKQHLPKNIADANTTLVETWLNDDKSFYETKASELVYNKVKDCSCTLVTSNSGFGKTAIIRHIALKLKSEGFEIVPVESPEDIIKYKLNKKQVFLIDDVLGKYDLSPTLLEKWERINEKLISCLETELGLNKILCTLRLQIASHTRFKNASTILNKEVVDLESESNALSKEEKQNILTKHLKINNLEKEITTEEVEIICEMGHAFPLLCKLVATDEERFTNRIVFFRQPLSLLRNELDRISIENKKLYCILVICMLHNGSFPIKIFDIGSDENDEKIYRIMQACGLQINMPKNELEDSAFSAIGSYFTMDSYNFQFIHDALEEMIGCHFYTFDPKVLFLDCDISFIRDRVRVDSNENINENNDQNIVIIREDELNEDRFTPLYTRMWTELNNGRFSSLLMSHLFKNRSFVRIFGTHFENNQSILGLEKTFLTTKSSEQKKISKQSVLEFLSKVKSSDELQDKKGAISRVIEAVLSFRSTLMYWIVAFGCNELFQYVWHKMTTLDRYWILGNDFIFIPTVKSFFPLAVLGGNLDIVTELISTGADVNCLSEFLETPLDIAVNSCRYDMVHLLVKNRANVNLRRWCTMNIPIAITSKKQECINLILEYDLNHTVLHEAILHKDLDNFRSKIRSENIDSKTMSGWTVLHYAVLLNDLEAVKVLFHEELPQNVDSQSDQRELLCRKLTPNIGIVDNYGLTAVHLAVINNNIEILSVLLSNTDEVKVRDVFDKTPLHYITSENATKSLLMHCSRNQSIQNSEMGREYEKTQMSAFKVMCFNITLNTSFRTVCRNSLNMPDKQGNTPLHSVINRCLSKEEKSNCIESLLENGANPYLFNDSHTSALELFESSRDTIKYINNSAKYKQSIEYTYKVFALIIFFLMGLTFSLAIYLSSVIIQKSQNAFFCDGQDIESSNFTLLQMKRSINVILFIFVLLWLLSITFYMRYSHLFRRCLFIVLAFIILGCSFFILFGALIDIQIMYRYMYAMLIIFILSSVIIKILSFYTNATSVLLLHLKQDKTVFSIIWLALIVCIFSFIVSLMELVDGVKFDNFYPTRNVNTLDINASNCTKLSFVNISCTSLTYNITYKNISVECRNNPNITSYNGTYGTLTLESGFFNLLDMGLMSLFCLNLSLHAICVYCFMHYIVVFMKKMRWKINFPDVYAAEMAILYLDIFCHIFMPHLQ